MIRELYVDNFKSLNKIQIKMSNLNVICGANGSGKSSLIQSILLLKNIDLRTGTNSPPESYYSNTQLYTELNNNDLDLGLVEDVLSENGGDEIQIEVKSNNGQIYNFVLKSNGQDKNKDFLIVSQTVSDSLAKSEVEPKTLIQEIKEIKFLKANRVGSQLVQQRNSIQINYSNIGTTGEFAYELLMVFQNNNIGENSLRYHTEAADYTLFEQTNAWLKEICSNINIRPTYIANTSFTTSTYSMNSQSGKSRNYRPSNIGFGISYVLPVIILCLIAKPGNIIIIDTPEAHLHPKAQLKIGQLIAKTAADGVQIIVETHSDHIINGIRLAVIDNIIASEKVKFNFFDLINDSNITFSSRVQFPSLNDMGQFDFWPDGFFDEWDNAVSAILQKQFKR